jgi:hypothetical protein
VSSKRSGGEHDSTGLRAKQKLITPLLRCASPETATLYSELFETTQQNKKGSHRLPFLHFRRGEKRQVGYARHNCRIYGQILVSLTVVAMMRNRAVMVAASPGMPVMVPVVRRGAISRLRLRRARCRQDRSNRQHEQC